MVAKGAVLPITDTHQHLWDLSALEVPWLESLPTLNRSFTMGEYLPQARTAGVTRSVYVEVDVAKGRDDDEIAYVTKLCGQDDNPLAGIVAPGDPMRDDFAERVTHLARAPFVKGVRQVLHTPDQPPGVCLDPRFVEGVRLLGKHGLSFDVCIRANELGDAVALARQCPNTTIVIDHCGNATPSWFANPTDSSAEVAAFRAALEELGGLANTVCKLSGIVVRLESDSPLETLKHTLDFCVSVFGHERVMLGSDWPVCTLRTDMGPWLDLARSFVQSLPSTAHAPVLSENAARVYRLE